MTKKVNRIFLPGKSDLFQKNRKFFGNLPGNIDCFYPDPRPLISNQIDAAAIVVNDYNIIHIIGPALYAYRPATCYEHKIAIIMLALSLLSAKSNIRRLSQAILIF